MPIDTHALCQGTKGLRSYTGCDGFSIRSSYFGIHLNGAAGSACPVRNSLSMNCTATYWPQQVLCFQPYKPYRSGQQLVGPMKRQGRAGQGRVGRPGTLSAASLTTRSLYILMLMLMQFTAAASMTHLLRASFLRCNANCDCSCCTAALSAVTLRLKASMFIMVLSTAA